MTQDKLTALVKTWRKEAKAICSEAKERGGWTTFEETKWTMLCRCARELSDALRAKRKEK